MYSGFHMKRYLVKGRLVPLIMKYLLWVPGEGTALTDDLLLVPLSLGAIVHAVTHLQQKRTSVINSFQRRNPEL
jgi:hypothetical protein